MDLAGALANIGVSLAKARENAPLASPRLTLMGVSKGHGAEAIENAIELGVFVFGENRVQEAEGKWPDIKKRHPKVILHLIGPLQTNKIKQALELFDVIQTLDRPKLAEEIARHMDGKEIKTRQFYIQVNTGEEEQKAGVSPKEADDFIAYCTGELKLPVAGLMCIPPVDDLPGPHFALLRQIALKHNLPELSMGMSDDFETAVRLGSTCVRIGRALFGERPE